MERNGDLISRQAAIDALKHNQDVYSHNFHDDPIDKYTTAIIAVDIDSLVKLPSAHSEIIRCKDCKWYGRADKRRFYRGTDCTQKRIDTIIPDKDFCSRAERREV